MGTDRGAGSPAVPLSRGRAPPLPESGSQYHETELEDAMPETTSSEGTRTPVLSVSIEVPYLDAEVAGDAQRMRELPGRPVVVPGGTMVAVVPMKMGRRGQPTPCGSASLVPGAEFVGVIPINIP